MLTRNLKIAASVLAVFCFVAFGGDAIIPSSQVASVRLAYDPGDPSLGTNPYTGTYYDSSGYNDPNAMTPASGSYTGGQIEQYGSVGDASFDSPPSNGSVPTTGQYSSGVWSSDYYDCLYRSGVNCGSPTSQNNSVGLGGNNPPANVGLGGNNPSGSSGGTITLQNPLKAKTIGELLRALIDIMIVFAIPLIVMMIIYAGFLYVTARGNESNIKRAHLALTSAIIGGLLILGAEMLITVIQGTVNQLR